MCVCVCLLSSLFFFSSFPSFFFFDIHAEAKDASEK